MNIRLLFSLEIIAEWLESNHYVIRDLGLLSSCLERPWQTFGADQLYPTPYEKSAAILDSITRNHPLVDGNKRLGVLLASLMLRSHGIDDRRIPDDDWFDLSIGIITKHPPIEVVAESLRTLVEAER